MAPSDDSLPLRLTTGDMAYGPHAVARHDGKVVFVRGAAPQEVVEARLREDRRTYAFADVVRVVEPSVQRRIAPCPYLPACGGCSWQHLAYEAQLAAKRRLVEEQLRRIARLDLAVPPVLACPQEFGGRRRIKLKVAHGEVGFYAAASHQLVPIAHCLLAEPAVDAGVGAARALVHAVGLPIRRIELIACSAAGADIVVAAEIEGSWDGREDENCRRWLDAQPQVRGLALHGRGWRRRWGDVRIEVEPEPGLILTAHAPAFTQVNLAANRLLVATVVRWADPQPGQQILDLYAGIGNLSLPLRRRGAVVVAVEHDRQAAADAGANGERYPGPPLRIICGRAERVAAQLAAEGMRFDVVVLDPPRSGAAGCLPALLQLAPPRVIYVACDPATLARDLALLRTRYRIDSVQPLDMFPQTYHVETIVRATLSCESPTPGVSSARRHRSAEPSRRRRTRGRRV